MHLSFLSFVKILKSVDFVFHKFRYILAIISSNILFCPTFHPLLGLSLHICSMFLYCSIGVWNYFHFLSFFCFSDWIICIDLSSSSWTTLSSPSAKPTQCIFNFRYSFQFQNFYRFSYGIISLLRFSMFLLISSIFSSHMWA